MTQPHLLPLLILIPQDVLNLQRERAVRSFDRLQNIKDGVSQDGTERPCSASKLLLDKVRVGAQPSF